MSEVSIEVDATLENTRIISEFAAAALQHMDVPRTQADRLFLAIDELTTNIILYAYPAAKGRLRLCLRREQDTVIAELFDQGQPFDPTQRPAPDLDKPIEEREIGGLGIHLTRNMVDEIRYAREGQTNHLSLRLKMA